MNGGGGKKKLSRAFGIQKNNAAVRVRRGNLKQTQKKQRKHSGVWEEHFRKKREEGKKKIHRGEIVGPIEGRSVCECGETERSLKRKGGPFLTEMSYLKKSLEERCDKNPKWREASSPILSGT